jgi:uncharacterized membrane protein
MQTFIPIIMPSGHGHGPIDPSLVAAMFIIANALAIPAILYVLRKTKGHTGSLGDRLTIDAPLIPSIYFGVVMFFDVISLFIIASEWLAKHL